MGVRDKLLDFKQRLSDRKMYSIVIVAIAAVALWGFYQYREASQYRQRLDNQYNRAFFDTVGYVNNVETLLGKALISSTPTKAASTLQEAWRQANMAQANLGQLPVSQPVLANTSKFLTQLGDFSYTMNYQNMQGKPVDDAQYKTIEQLHGLAISLNKSLVNLQNQITSGRLRWGELAQKGTPIFRKTSAQLPGQQQFRNVDKVFQQYPTLIYDGPFSDHLVTIQPRGLTGAQVTPDQGKQAIINFLGAGNVNAVEYAGKNNTDPIRTYSYRVSFKNAPKDQIANIDVTQKGGHIFWMLQHRPTGAAKITVEQAKEAGKRFFESRGIKGMIDTYYLREGNTATINYAYKQDNVIIYPDLIKLKIALDNGQIIGFESKSYLSAHTARQIPAPRLTMAQARAKISSRLKISSSGMAIIPTDYKTEILTYEFKGKLNNQDFLVYINADNGVEEKILMIINTPNGILTM